MFVDKRVKGAYELFICHAESLVRVHSAEETVIVLAFYLKTTTQLTPYQGIHLLKIIWFADEGICTHLISQGLVPFVRA